MSAAPKRKMTATEYLEIERKAAHKSEFYDGEMFAMAGANNEHNIVKENLVGEMFNRLKGTSCRSYSSDQRVLVDPTGLYAYPDVVIVCGTAIFSNHDDQSLMNPRVIFEVLSSSTERYDRTTKFRHYTQLPSLQEYILVSQDEPLIEQFVRQPNGKWTVSMHHSLTENFALASIPIEIPMADLYRDVTFPPTA